ncbi:MAG: siderophore-interacting protein [Actinobacteria bacterium]|nr:siderophore-interacting protein [Actinomycetota bacterium]
MADSAPPGAVTDDPFARLEGPLAGTTRMRLTVTQNRPLTPSLQQVVLTAPELAGFGWRPGQDIMLMVAVADGRPVRRRYTIRATDPEQRLVTLGIVRHGNEGPGERWVSGARPGDTVEGIGPRGKIFLAPGADWHLFIGDHAALPAFFTMAGALPAGQRAVVLLEIPGPADEQQPPAGDVSVSWLHRGDRAAGEPGPLAEAAGQVPLPPGRGQAYLAGEAKAVLALREVLAARGMPGDQVSAKAYWGRGRANASHGEPARD